MDFKRLTTPVFSLILNLVQVVRMTEVTQMRMPDVIPAYNEQYLCRRLKISDAREHYLIGFEPIATMNTAHHMLLFGCETPGSTERVWDCGEMASKDRMSPFQPGTVCGKGSSSVLYAWARDAPKLELPEGVGFKTGGDSDIQYLVLQVHYMHKMEEPDSSGIKIKSVTRPMPKEAAVLLLATNGMMKAHSKENFETACLIDDEGIEMHPFAFRTHTHRHGKSVSGYIVDGKTEEWKLIGKRDPMLPQMFYPVEDKNLVIKTGDVIAARCTMVNEEDRDVKVGGSDNDEMCNFYMMYWVDNGRLPDQNTCLSPGPPNYYWKHQAGLKNVPEDKR